MQPNPHQPPQPSPQHAAAAEPRSVERLTQLIAAKRQVLEQILELTKTQQQQIQADDLTKMLRILTVKDRLIRNLNSLETALNPYRDDDPDSRPWPTMDARLKCRADSERCEQVLAAVLQLEQECDEAMRTRRDQIATQVHAAHDAARARHAYNSTQSQRSQQLDLSSE